MSVKMRQILTDNLSRIGMVDPILVAIDKDRYRIVDGEHRYRIAVELGYEEVPCVILNEEVPLTEQKKQTIRMNQIKGQLSYDKFNSLVDTLRTTFNVDEGLLPFELGFESANSMNMVYPVDEAPEKKKRTKIDTDATVSLKHLYRITEKYFNGDTAGCFLIAHIDKDSSLLLEFDESGLGLLEAARIEASNDDTNFELWLADKIAKRIAEYE
jgi:hypothetical protein